MLTVAATAYPARPDVTMPRVVVTEKAGGAEALYIAPCTMMIFGVPFDAVLLSIDGQLHTVELDTFAAEWMAMGVTPGAAL